MSSTSNFVCVCGDISCCKFFEEYHFTDNFVNTDFVFSNKIIFDNKEFLHKNSKKYLTLDNFCVNLAQKQYYSTLLVPYYYLTIVDFCANVRGGDVL